MKRIILLFSLVLSFSACQPQDSITFDFNESYETFKEDSLFHRRFKYNTVQRLIDDLRNDDTFEVRKVGESIEGLSLNLVSLGQGETDIFLWSQMHGNEPTATQAIFDILNFFAADTLQEVKEEILSKTKLHFLPMLNPDGADTYKRRNALGIDINRDALRLQSPEGQTLKRVRDSLKAEFGFNLHDQSTYYNAKMSDKPATISYLAPAYNYEKEINTVRANAMKVIVVMNNIVQQFVPGQVGRYNDDFEPRAFGDNIQKWGTSTILIESGGYTNDPEKQEIRRLNYVSILGAIHSIATKSYENASLEDYEKIPKNDRKLFDVKITGADYQLFGKTYTIDIGINRNERNTEELDDYFVEGEVVDVGDLSTYYGYRAIDGSGLRLSQGAIYRENFNSIDDLDGLDFKALLRTGYTFVRVKEIPENLDFSPYPINIISQDFELRSLKMKPGIPANLYLIQDGQAVFTVMNGFVYDYNTDITTIKNGQIYR